MLLYNGETVMFTIGPFEIKEEGFLLMVVILARFLCIITLVVILLETTSLLTIVGVMAFYKVPSLLTEMILFSYRYYFQVTDTLFSMQTAMKLRGFKGKSYKDLKYLSSLIGTILIRSYEQSERVYYAMVLRGYGQKNN